MNYGNSGRLPTVFVSSTCYDLKQIRKDIKDFIEHHLGFDAILSEYDSFPLDPNIGNIQNCIRIVRERADIFILVVGNRYGHITGNGKSITNLEYINARAKGIPIYVFVDKSLLNVLPIWKNNPTIDLTNIVDTPKLFEFIDDLRGKENIWVHEFESAQDIIKTLKRQIGYLFYDSLILRQQVNKKNLSSKVINLDGESLKIVLEKPVGWEYILLGNIMATKFKQSEDLKRDLKYGISFGQVQNLNEINEFLNWIVDKNSELILVTSALSSLFNNAIPIAMGEPGEPGDVEQIIYVGERLGTIYEKFLNWGLDFKRISVNDEWKEVKNTLSRMWESPISDLESYCAKYSEAMNRLALIPHDSEESIELDLTLTLNEPDLTEFYRELNIVRARYGLL
ncbi:DUF4062 domain-containing protein [Alkaliphilus oremlandii]|uniref:DUF4062 domain-containing protein n=1 Tax=Alkaliphilus oremlandii (strain OhILAs) TaxID=350688 RepID=A8MHZ7_ALKOO|nr:DUF4062 domain-containing protein [Alkaliphilus oremlandii]ABW19429.1 conserved hypothetical protein [Alkaliphilus oremlandii OhILAs]